MLYGPLVPALVGSSPVPVVVVALMRSDGSLSPLPLFSDCVLFPSYLLYVGPILGGVVDEFLCIL